MGAVILVKVVPRAKKNGIAGLLGDSLKIRIQAPPVDGKANKMLIKFLGDILDVPESRVSILAGESGRSKRVRIEGIDSGTVCERIGL